MADTQVPPFWDQTVGPTRIRIRALREESAATSSAALAFAKIDADDARAAGTLAKPASCYLVVEASFALPAGHGGDDARNPRRVVNTVIRRGRTDFTLWREPTDANEPQRDGRARLPRPAEPWRTIVRWPGGHLNDFTLFADPGDGRWHAIGILGSGTWESEVSLFHASGERLGELFENHRPLLAQPAPPDVMPGKHCPSLVVRDGVYHLFYRRPMGTMMHVRGRSPFEFDDLGEVVFTANDARDACILDSAAFPGPRQADWPPERYWMYYCQIAEHEGVVRSCILLRTSDDLEGWSEPRVAFADLFHQPAGHCYTESPFVIRRPEGFYLLTRHCFAGPHTNVRYSPTPLFGCANGGWLTTIRDCHAAECIEHEGKVWIARVTSGRDARCGRVDIAPLEWV